jgi:PAS domain S-box-containing protein
MNEDTKTIKVLIVGAGTGGRALIDVMYNMPLVLVTGIVDTNENAPGMLRAKELNIPTYNDFVDVVSSGGVDEIINVTGSKEVQRKLSEIAPRGVGVVGGHSAKLFWNVIEEHAEALRVLRDSRNRIMGVFESLLTGVVVIDADTHTIVDANPIAIKMIGTEKKNIIGRVCHQFICPAETGKCPITDLGQTIDKSERTLLRADGRAMPVLKSVTTMVLNKKTYVIDSFMDISEQKKAEEELREATEIKSKFLSMASHELKNPLSSIDMALGIVLDGVAGKVNDKQRDALGRAKKQLDRLIRLTKDILDFQSLNKGTMRFDMQPNDLNNTAREVFHDYLQPMEKAGLSLKLNLDEGLPRDSLFDKDRILQVLINLINNASKFTTDGGIEIITCRDGNFMHVMVKDTGCGIDEKDLAKMFNSFEQLDNVKMAKEKGTGLGLAICKDIIAKHGGNIWCESAPEIGSTLHFTIPIKR